MLSVSATMCASPQGAGRTRSPPLAYLPSRGKVREHVVFIVAVTRLRSRLDLLRRSARYGSYCPVFDLVPAPGPGLRNLSHELLPDQALQRDSGTLVEVLTQASLEDRPGFRALLDLAGIFVAVGVVVELVAVVHSAHYLKVQVDLRAVGLRLVRGHDLQPAHPLRNYFLGCEANFRH